MDITMLGTGSALVTECYNTCFVLSDGDEHFLVDGGGGNGILSQLKKAGFNWQDMRTIFVTHKHVDHILGAVWMIRMICQHMKKVRMKAKPLYTDMTRSSLYLGRWQCNFLIRRRQYILVTDFIWLR